ncbi:MAG: FtsQ-type POTRA domain-containing protein [Clostridia bacterium]|nr:FtsQ-type POTRA domain-containing protein [Clostridia bacterium]
MKNNENDAVKATRQKLESIRNNLCMKYGEKGARRILTAVAVAVVALVALLILIFLFPIRSIAVSGEVTMFNEGEIIEAAEISEGDSIFLRSSWDIKRTIRKNLPLADEIKVTKTLSGTVKIKITFDDVKYYTKVDGIYYAIGSELRVLDSNESGAKYSAYGAVYVRLPETRPLEIGEKIVFYDTVEETDTEGETLYEVIDVKYYSYVTDFLSKLEDSGFWEQANGISLTEKYDVTLIYADKYKISFGSISELESKFRVLFGILDEGSTQYADKVEIDLTNPSAAIARPNPELDLEQYID